MKKNPKGKPFKLPPVPKMLSDAENTRDPKKQRGEQRSNNLLREIIDAKTPKAKYKLFEERGKELTFNARGAIFSKLGGVGVAKSLGIPSFNRLLEDTIDPAFGPKEGQTFAAFLTAKTGNGDLVQAMKFDKNKPISSAEAEGLAKENAHMSYDVAFVGEPVGRFKEPIPLYDATKEYYENYPKVIRERDKLGTTIMKMPYGLGWKEKDYIANIGDYTAKETVGGELRFAKAFHGTPNTIEGRFSTDKIGTGEGQQVYGWGLYFAGHKRVADWYHKGLTKEEYKIKMPSSDINEYYKKGNTIEFEATMHSSSLGIGGKTEPFVNLKIVGEPKLIGGSLPSHFKVEVEGGLILTNLGMGYWQPTEKKKFIFSQAPSNEQFNKVTGRDLTNLPKGGVYQVDLAPEEDDYLNLDKKINEQGNKVKNLIETIYKETEIKPEKKTNQKFGGLPATESTASYNIFKRKKESQRAKELSQPKSGPFKIKPKPKQPSFYLDDAALLDSQAARQRGIPNWDRLGHPDMTGKQLYNWISTRFEEGNVDSSLKDNGEIGMGASSYLLSKGIRGNKYLDGSSRKKGEGNHNYVIFDDSDITIEAKFAKKQSQPTAAELEAEFRKKGVKVKPDTSIPKDKLTLGNKKKDAGGLYTRETITGTEHIRSDADLTNMEM